jgi:hypothetical protein
MEASKFLKWLFGLFIIIGASVTLYFYGYALLAVIAGILLIGLALIFGSNE